MRQVPNAGASARWKHKAAGIVATLVQLAALCSLVLTYDVGGHDRFSVLTYQVFSVLGLPVDGSVVIALVLGVLGAALRRRKRAALNMLLLFQTVQIAFLIGMLGWRAGHHRMFRISAEHWVSPSASTELLVFVSVAAIAVLVVLILLRPAFPARIAPGAFRRALEPLIAGLLATSVIGWLLTELFPGRLDDLTERMGWAVNQVFGRVFALRPLGVHGEGPAWLSVLLGVVSAAIAGYALIQFFLSVRDRRALTSAEELRIRELLAEHGEADSLGYLATRRDKSVVFAPNGRAAVTYRVLGGTSLASADPIGDPESWPAAVQAWLTESASYGWIPAVLGASERGARCYRRAGLKALELGDEAIVGTRWFNLSDRNRRSVRQAVHRVQRAGYRTLIRRYGDIPDEHMHRLSELADAWRGADAERGFSMALSRLGDPADGRCVLVEAYDKAGELRGMLSFVPWGRTGLSLDLMRRDRDAENGLNEYMVAELVGAAPDLGVSRISLNFAMFRSVFASGERIGAGPVLLTWRSVLAFFSRFFQLESLYRSNAKYGPDWYPRYVCFQRARQVPRVGVVAGMAEGFLPYWRRMSVPHNASASAEFLDAVQDIEERHRERGGAEPGLGQQAAVRLAKVDRLRSRGIEPYPAAYERDALLGTVRAEFAGLLPDARTGRRLRVAGRVLAKRDLGGMCFLVLRDFTGDLQVMLDAAGLGRAGVRDAVRTIDLGDQIGVAGEIGTSRRGELSVLADDWTITAKCLHPFPAKRGGLSNPEARVRQRYLDLAVHADARSMLELRSRVITAIRGFLGERDYLEVETPMLQNVHGGANARPFVSHINAYDQNVYLRIAPELYLKRLCVAGVDRVFELNRNFRNEGADATHNPEFTMLEAYAAYADYRVMLDLARELIQYAARAAYGAEIAERDGQTYDISGRWPVVPVADAVAAKLGRPAADLTGEQILKVYETLVEPATVEPTFYIDFPVEGCPLTRQHRSNPGVAERWDLVAFGTEIGTAYTELTDPVEQRRRLAAQSKAAAGGDVEAMELDEDFLRALEYGMPPTGGLGMGVDRVLMMLTGAPIRQTLPFPYVRPERRGRVSAAAPGASAPRSDAVPRHADDPAVLGSR
jgi:lysyl-tRNA synthetase class 2